MAQGQNIVELLLRDHRKIESLLGMLDGESDEELGDYFCNLREELIRHEMAEELVVYPAFRKNVGGGNAIADACIAEQSEAEETLAALEKEDTTSISFRTQLGALRQSVLAHAKHEEADVFPALQRDTGASELAELGDRYDKALDAAPTHPHPHAAGHAASQQGSGPDGCPRRSGARRHACRLIRAIPSAPCVFVVLALTARESAGCAVGKAFATSGPAAKRSMRDACADPKPRRSSGLDGRLDMPHSQRPHSGHRDRRRRQAPVSLPRRLAAASRNAEKFVRIVEFASRLPELREHVAADLELPGLPRQRVLALGLRLLDLGMFRIGGEEYAEDHETYGVATVEKRHVQIRQGIAYFDYPAKSGKRRQIAIDDPKIVTLLQHLKRRRGGGTGLLAWRDAGGWVDVSSHDVNSYLKEIAGDDFSAKDFRTWDVPARGGVVRPRTLAGCFGLGRHRRSASGVIRQVAESLGDTPAVCRKSYVDPRILDCFACGQTIAQAVARLDSPEELHDPATLSAVERAVIEMLTDDRPLEAWPDQHGPSPALPLAQWERRCQPVCSEPVWVQLEERRRTGAVISVASVRRFPIAKAPSQCAGPNGGECRMATTKQEQGSPGEHEAEPARSKAPERMAKEVPATHQGMSTAEENRLADSAFAFPKESGSN